MNISKDNLTRTAPFQGLRLIGIITIVAGHAGLNLVGGGNWCTFFFILSGFLYKTQISNWKNYFDYIWHKASRLYPIYWICLFLYLGLAVLRGSIPDYSLDWDFIPHFLLLQSWIPAVAAMAYLGPAWFLSSLLFCYCFSFLVKGIIDKSSWTIIGLIVIYLLWIHLGFDNYVNPIYRLLEYSLGIWIRQWLCKRPPYKEIFPGFCLLIVVAFLYVLRIGVPSWLNILLFAGIIYGVYMIPSNILTLCLGNTVLLNLSKYDIFIYLTHPGIGFHLAFFFLGTSSLYAIIVSVLFGCLLGFSFSKIRNIALTKTICK